MNGMEGLHRELEDKYSYKRESPVSEREGYVVYEALQKDLNVPVTLKLMASPTPELIRYLKKIKQLKVEFTIKIYEIFEGSDGLCVATEQAAFSTLRHALEKCQKLDDADAIFLCKLILSAHIDLLRGGINWFGTEDDIEFSQGGLRLSWNNSIPFQTENPFPLILSKLAGRIDAPQQKMLPFPRSRVLDDLIAASSLNASEIALNNNMKKKERPAKRRGKTWVGLKETRNDYDYYEETQLLAVHKDAGFVRVKLLASGKLDPEVLNLNKTKNTFTRVLEQYEEGGRCYFVSEYSNDGSLYSYVNRLKANAVSLREEQIQFCFYSLFEPLKLIQQSTIKSLCMLHIRNIYIENGIPKIGQPVPLAPDLTQQLREKADVPDFYHSEFKRNPNSKTNSFDTYSLGVLLYKLMYTEYPIFPQGKVHIPTTPAYGQRLKTTLQVFLDEGGPLKELEKKIEVSEEVAKQVKLNKNKLLQQKQKSQREKKDANFDQDEELVEKEDEPAAEPQAKTEGQGQYDQEQGEECCRLCCAQLEDPVKHRSLMLDSLEESPYAGYRLCTKAILVLCLYLFLFYLTFMQNTGSLILGYSTLQRLNVTVSTLPYEITVSSSTTFYTAFNVTDRSVAALVGLGCFINKSGGTDYSSVAMASSYRSYIIMAAFAMAVLIVLKLVQLVKFDIIRTLFNMSNLRANFNLSNYLIYHFLFASLIHSHYVLFNQIFNSSSSCLGVTQPFGSTTTYFTSPSMFTAAFATPFILMFLVVLLHLIMVVRTDTIRYTRLFNPILLLLPVLIGYTVVARIGVVTAYFYPSILKDANELATFFINRDYVNIIGILPEFLFLFEVILEWLVDWAYWLTIDKKRRMLIHDISSAGIII